MIPVRLQISGFLSYLDPVDIDFTPFTVACISGSNGAGKSSLLDAMTWALFGQARRRDDAIINSRAKMAEVIFDLQYEGELYRVQRVKTRDKAVVLEFFARVDESWKPLTERSVNATERRIEQILRMDYETFVNASFFLQGKADMFSQQRPGDRKRILSSILGLEVWESYRVAAAERRKRLEAEQSSVDGLLAEIQAELDLEAERKQRLTALEEQLGQFQQLRGAKEASMDALRRLAASLAEQSRLIEVLSGQLEAARTRQAERGAQLEARRAEQQAYQQELACEQDVTLAYQRWQQARKDLEQWEQVAANFRQYDQQRSAPILTIESERARLEQERQTLAAQERAIDEAAQRLPAISAQVEELYASLAVLAGRLNQRPVLESELREMQAQQGEASAENRRLRDEMAELKERIDRLKEVEGAACPLCGQPMTLSERSALIAALEAQGREKGDHYRENADYLKQYEGRRKDIEKQLEAFGPLETEIRKQQRALDQLEDQQTQVQQAQAAWTAGGGPRLAMLDDVLARGEFALEARAELARIDAALKELGYDAAAHDEARRVEQELRASEQQLRHLDTARAALGPLEREIARLQQQYEQDSAEVDKQADEVTRLRERHDADAASLPDMNQAESELFGLQEQENRLRMQVGGARQAVQVLDAQRKRHAELSNRRAGLAHRIAQHKTLERAFGKDGVPALLIEQALPEIEMHTNEILDRLSGGSMAVRFATQKDFKDKNREDKKETLDILISDASGVREYELFSGGEAFRINFAIRLALSRFLSQRAGARLQTLVIDEGFGSQDADGRQRLIEAIHLVQPDFAKILAITHMEELKEAFPVRLEVEKTPRGSRVRVLA